MGPERVTVTGTLKDWDVIDRLEELEVPTLITSGSGSSRQMWRRLNSSSAAFPSSPGGSSA